jgi:hypothetical protein
MSNKFTRSFRISKFYDVNISRDQGSGIRDQRSGIRDQRSGIRDQESGIRNQGSEIRDQESGRIRDQVRERDVNNLKKGGFILTNHQLLLLVLVSY